MIKFFKGQTVRVTGDLPERGEVGEVIRDPDTLIVDRGQVAVILESHPYDVNLYLDDELEVLS